MNKLKYTATVFALSVALIGGAHATEAQTFKDVPVDAQYYEAVEKLAELGIITKAEKFNPQNTLTRGQMAKIVALALNLDTKNVKDPKFKDVPTSHQFYPYIAALVNAGIVNGYPDGTYGVGKNVTRAHMAKFVVNGFGLKKSGEMMDFGENLKPGTELHNNAATLAFYEIGYIASQPHEDLQRAEAATMITNAMAVKSTKEVRVPFNKLGLPENGEDFYISTSSTQRIAHVAKDIFNNEVVVRGLAEGSTYAAIEVKNHNYFMLIDIDAQLNVSYKQADSFDSQYKEIREMNVYSEIESKIITATLEQVTGTDRVKQSLVPVEDVNYVFIPTSAEKLGEVFKVTFEHANGQTKDAYVRIQEDSHFIFAGQLDVGTANAVKLDFGPGEYTIEGNSEAVKVVAGKSYFGEEQDIFELSKVGNYTFTSKEDSEYIIKVEVIEVDGKLMANASREYLE